MCLKATLTSSLLTCVGLTSSSLMSRCSPSSYIFHGKGKREGKKDKTHVTMRAEYVTATIKAWFSLSSSHFYRQDEKPEKTCFRL